MSDVIQTETHGRVRVITMNRPEAKNAVNTPLAQGLVAAIEELDGDDGLTAGVLTGAGGGFSAGMDLCELTATYATDNKRRAIDRLAAKGCKVRTFPYDWSLNDAAKR